MVATKSRPQSPFGLNRHTAHWSPLRLGLDRHTARWSPLRLGLDSHSASIAIRPTPLSSASNAIPPRSPTARWWLINLRLPFGPTVANRSLFGPLVAIHNGSSSNHCTTDRNTIQWIQPYNGSRYHTETRPRSDRGEHAGQVAQNLKQHTAVGSGPLTASVVYAGQVAETLKQHKVHLGARPCAGSEEQGRSSR